jgi:short-chain Z-isoprenyl diphosphate synthase
MSEYLRPVNVTSAGAIGCGPDPGNAALSETAARATLGFAMAFGPRSLAYRLYESRLTGQIRGGPMPHHVGVILDGNRRWARATGYTDAAEGHRRGAAKIDELLGWCDELGIPVVTLWLLSTENLTRDPAEIQALLGIIEDEVRQLSTRESWRIRALGNLEMLPASTVGVLNDAERITEAHAGRELNVAVGYGGRQEIVDAIRRMLVEYDEKGMDLSEAATKVSPEEIARFLYTAGTPDPDLIIRTSGEVRLSGFLLWQSAHSEFFFCDPYWPDFRRIDFLRALREYQQRHRRYGR